MKNVKQFDFTLFHVKHVSCASDSYCLKINNLDLCTLYGSRNILSKRGKSITKSFEVRW